MRKHKFLTFLLAYSVLFSGVMLSSYATKGYAAFTFSAESTSINPVPTVVTNWTFNNQEPGTTIVIDGDGNATISGGEHDGESVDITYVTDDDENDLINNGSVTTQIEINEDGTVSITQFDVSPGSSAIGDAFNYIFYGETLYLPSQYVIDGQEYPVTSLDQPLKVQKAKLLIGSISAVDTVIVPEGYVSICDEAFYGNNCSFKTPVTFNLPSTLTSIGYRAIDLADSPKINYAGTKAQFRALSNASPNWVGRSSGNNNSITVTCSDGNLTVRYNGNTGAITIS
jgi:hypothetical protein